MDYDLFEFSLTTDAIPLSTYLIVAIVLSSISLIFVAIILFFMALNYCKTR